MNTRDRIFLLALIAAIQGCQTPPGQASSASSTAPAASASLTSEEDRRQSRPAPVGGGAELPESRHASTMMAENAQPPTGRRCEVYLRRDALGMAGPAPLGPNLDSLTHREAAVSGTIDQVTDGWIVLRSSTGKLWIPRANVLMIEVLDH